MSKKRVGGLPFIVLCELHASSCHFLQQQCHPSRCKQELFWSHTTDCHDNLVQVASSGRASVAVRGSGSASAMSCSSTPQCCCWTSPPQVSALLCNL